MDKGMEILFSPKRGKVPIIDFVFLTLDYYSRKKKNENNTPNTKPNRAKNLLNHRHLSLSATNTMPRPIFPRTLPTRAGPTPHPYLLPSIYLSIHGTNDHVLSESHSSAASTQRNHKFKG